MYGEGDLDLAFLAAVISWLCLHAAATACGPARPAVHGAAFALAVGAFSYLHWCRRGGLRLTAARDDPTRLRRDPGRPTAREAVRRAAELAQLCGAQLTLVSAYRPVSTTAALALSGGGTGLMVDGAARRRSSSTP